MVIGGGYAGLSSASALAKRGYEVVLVERHEQLGGRSRTWEKDGFRFDMGPSWYWMPEVFEEYFKEFGKERSKYYGLKRLDPAYRVFFEGDSVVDVPDKLSELKDLFEKREKGSAKQLDSFLKQAEYKYRVGMTDYVWRPSVSWFEFLDPRLAIQALRLDMLVSTRTHVKRFFKDSKLVKLMEWPVLFLGGGPDRIPALYSLMSHAAIVGGTHYPCSEGMHAPILAMVEVARELGVDIRTGDEVLRIHTSKGRATSVEMASGEQHDADVVVAAADYHHVEQQLLSKNDRTYDEKYWDSRVITKKCWVITKVRREVLGVSGYN